MSKYTVDRAADVAAKLINVVYNEDVDVAIAALEAAKVIVNQKIAIDIRTQMMYKMLLDTGTKQ